jgi:predicted RNA-binding Zn ribbon-like protein
LHLADNGCAADKYAARAVVGLTGIVTQMGPQRLGSCADAACRGVFIDASTNLSRRFCSDRCAAKVRANVTAFPGRRRNHDAGRASTAAS